MVLSFFRGLPLTLAFFSFLLSANGQNAVAGSSSSSSSGARYGDLSASAPVDVGLTSDAFDNQYIVDIVLGGQKFSVIVDTGSSDLWVDMQGQGIQLVNTTDLVVDTHYAIGDVKGNVLFSELRLGPYVIPSQAFINATNVTSMPEGTQGIIGMAFETAKIYTTMRDTWSPETANELARGAMSNLLAQNPSAPGYFDLELGRTSINGTKSNNHFFIGQHFESAAAVANAPKLERVNDQHWTVVMDGLNINGQPFTGWNKSIVAGVPDGKVAAVFDSGFTMSSFPKAVVDAIYGSIPGAVRYDYPGATPGQSNWIIPCNASANISFVFAGQEYPVHPLDVVSFSTALGLAELDGITLLANASLCTNHFFSGDPDPDNSYDILLGMGFLRNVYASFQYGDYTPPGINMTGQLPYVQLLSVTDKDAAWAEYYDYYLQKVVAGPPEPAPSVWPQFFTDFENLGGDDSDSDSGDNSTSTASPSTTAGGAPGTGATSGPTSVATSSPADSTDESQNLEVAGFAAEDSSSSSKDSGNSQYGGIALGLLAANVAVGLAVLMVTLTLCIRGAREKREARYKPLRLPKEDGGEDPERAVLYTD